MADDLVGIQVETGRMIRQLRLSKGMTLDGLASAVGCAKGYLSAIERGLRPPPREGLAGKLERALGAPEGSIERAAAWCRTPEVVRREVTEAGTGLVVDLRRVAGGGSAERVGWSGDEGGEPTVRAGDLVILGPMAAENEGLVAVGEGERVRVRRAGEGRPVLGMMRVLGDEEQHTAERFNGQMKTQPCGGLLGGEVGGEMGGTGGVVGAYRMGSGSVSG
jgi:transcriptional regulator with XRE-family HTH domain